MVDISVIVPSYNRVRTIEASIDSILSQDFDGTFEVIVSDDGSSDGTLELVRARYGEKVRLLQKPEDCMEQGAASARNRGLKEASGRYVSFLDSDDVYMPDFLKTMSAVLDAETGLGYIFCRVLKSVNNAGNEMTTSWTRKDMSVIDRRYHVLHRAYCVCTIGIMCRKDIIDRVGDFDVSLTVGEDSDMWIRISELSEGKFIDYPGAVYRIDGYADNQLSKLPAQRKSDDGRKVYEKALTRYKENALSDRMRLFLVLKGLYAYDCMRIGNRSLRNLQIIARLFLKMPLTAIRYMVLRQKV